MFDLFGKMFGTDKALAKVVDNASNAIDKLFYTEEEEAEAKAQAASEARTMIIDWMKSTQGQNLARRLIALSITGVWLLQYFFAWCFDLLAIFVSNAQTKLDLQAAALATDNRADTMVGAVMLILGFYFTAPYLGDIASAAIGKFGSKHARTG